MVGCAVFSCKRRSGTSNFTKDRVSYHIFPNNPTLRKEWITFCRRSDGWVPTRTSTICSDHFDPLSFQFLSKCNNRRRLNENAIPSILVCDCKKSELNTNPWDKDDPLDITGSSSFSPSESLVITPDYQQQLPMVSYASPSPETMPSASKFQLSETPRERRLKNQLEYKTKKIKRLQAKIRYLVKKVDDLQDLLNNLC